MKYRRLGTTDLDVSVICLGTMTWGEQNSEAEGHAQMDYALDHGVNFIDTAEMYSVPARRETYGRTEEIIGSWLEKNPARRGDFILASKVLARAERFGYVRPEINRDGVTKLDRKNILAACDASLKRLNTDYIDLYQLHWPDRETNFFGQLGYVHKPDDAFVPMEETFYALNELVKAGKVRYVGLSNETPWGMLDSLRLAEQKGLPRVQSIQNPYNLLKRDFEIGCAEIAIREKVGLLAYSPLAMGVLSGKYLGGNMPEGSRMALFQDYFPRYMRPKAVQETEKYVKLARDSALDPALMANAFVNQQPFLTANIIGARTMDQLKIAIDSGDFTLSDAVLAAIEEIHLETPFPVSH